MSTVSATAGALPYTEQKRQCDVSLLEHGCEVILKLEINLARFELASGWTSSAMLKISITIEDKLELKSMIHLII